MNLVYQIENNKVVKICSTHEEGGVCVQNFNKKGRGKFSNLSFDGILIRK